jgi:hypothetical protein
METKPIKIQDMRREYEANTLAELERILARRYGDDVNAFWISNTGKPPLLLILVNKALAYVFFFPSRDHPGFHSVGNIAGLDPHKFTTFYMNGIEEPEPYPNDAIVPVADALIAAREFFASQQLPPSMEWSEL